MKQIPLSNGQFALVDDKNYERLAKYKWWVNSDGYANRTSYHKKDGKWIGKKTSMHREIIDVKPGELIDHIDTDKLNNQEFNLRVCTNSQNQMNRGKQINNKSGFKGVHWSNRDKKWVAKITSSGKYFSLGHYSCRIEAAKAYNKAALQYHGEFCYLNEIP